MDPRFRVQDFGPITHTNKIAGEAACVHAYVLQKWNTKLIQATES